MTNFVKIVPACGFAIAVLMVVATSSFKGATSSPNVDSYFYEFVGDQTDINDVQSASKYQREDPGCAETEGDLCGIYLPHDAAPHANPLASDLSPHDVDLWSSAQNAASEDEGVIEMKE